MWGDDSSKAFKAINGHCQRDLSKRPFSMICLGFKKCLDGKGMYEKYCVMFRLTMGISIKVTGSPVLCSPSCTLVF